MPKCAPCVARKVKDVLERSFPELRLAFEQVPECKDGQLLELCSKKARSKSPRQVFMKDCLKGKHIKGFADAPRAMKACSLEWKQRQVGAHAK